MVDTKMVDKQPIFLYLFLYILVVYLLKNMELDLGKRRVQDYQGAALLCLPKSWVKSHGIVKGDRLRVIAQNDGSLRIEVPGVA
jgi:hypothetical protein